MLQFKESLYTVFLADDNPENLNLLGTVLEKEGYKTRAATNGVQALESIRLQKPDIVLLDVHMPKMDGYETCERLKADPDLSDIPVLFVSALDEPYNRIKGFEAGALDYIAKPFNATEVLARVKTHIQLKTRTCELKASLETLSRCQDTLILAEKQNYLGRLVFAMGHELNTPLGNLVLAQSQTREHVAEILESTDAAVREELEKIVEIMKVSERSLGQMKEMIGRFQLLGLDFQDAAASELNVRAALEVLPILLKDYPDSGKMRIVKKLPENLVWKGGYQTFYQILVNLLKNSLDHSGLDPGDLVATIDMEDDGKRFRIRYADNGKGIDRDIQPSVFDPFFTTRRRDSFMGLGLHLVFLIVARLGGDIAYADGDPGAVFSITVPVRGMDDDAGQQGIR